MIKNLWTRIRTNTKKLFKYMKKKGLFSLRGVISLILAFLILYSPAYIQIIIGAVSDNPALISSGVAVAVAIFTPIVPIGWLVIPIAVGIFSAWNLLIKRRNKKKTKNKK